VVGVLELRAVGGDALYVATQPQPAGEPVLASDHELGTGELQRLLGGRVMSGDAREDVGIADSMGAQQILGLLAQLLQAGSGGKRCGHGSLLSGSPGVRWHRAERRSRQ
jgi:hypothetical protein